MSKTPSKRLFNLIKNLSSSEKRYFKIFASKTTANKDNKYVLLFELVEGHEDYDEDAIKDAIYGNEKIQTRKFSELKAYLYDLILKSLLAFDENASVGFKVRGILQSVSVLYKRALYEDCKELLAKARKLIDRYELILERLEILKWEKKLAYTQSDVAFLDSNLERITHEEQTTIAQLQNESGYWNLFFGMLVQMKKEVIIRSEDKKTRLETIMNSPMMKNIEEADGWSSKVIFRRIRGLNFIATRDWENAYKEHKEIIQLVQSTPHLLKENPSEYISTINNMIVCCGFFNKLDEVNYYLETLRSVPTVTHDDEFKIFTLYFLGKLNYCSTVGDFEQGLVTIKACDLERKKFKDALFMPNFFYQYFYIYFGAGKYEEALFWVNEMLNLPKSMARQDLQGLARVMNLMIHYEMGNDLLLEHLLKSSYRFLRKRNQLYELERIMLSFFKKIKKTRSFGEKEKMFQTLKEEFQALKKKPNETALFNYFNFFAWIDSKIEGVTYPEAIKKYSED